MCLSSTHLVTDREVRCTTLTAGCSKSTHSCTLHLRLRRSVPVQSQLQPETSQCATCWDGGSPLGVAAHTPAVTTASLRASQHAFADLPVCPDCGLHSHTQKGQGCWRNDLCFALLTCEHSRTQRQTRELWGKIWQLFVFLFSFFFLWLFLFCAL